MLTIQIAIIVRIQIAIKRFGMVDVRLAHPQKEAYSNKLRVHLLSKCVIICVGKKMVVQLSLLEMMAIIVL